MQGLTLDIRVEDVVLVNEGLQHRLLRLLGGLGSRWVPLQVAHTKLSG